jgi:galactitol-specific phosphotransferase system IIC component
MTPELALAIVEARLLGVPVVWCLSLLLLPVPLERAVCLDGDQTQSLADG